MRRAAVLAAIAPAVVLGAASDHDPLSGYAVAGPPQRCVPMSSAASQTGFVIAADQLLTYRENPKRLWVGHPITTCSRMQPFDTLVVERFGGTVCRGDRFSVIQQGLSIPSAICIFGDFTPYDRLPKPAP